MINKKGFTLLEIVIVVIIIGILASLAIANYGKAKENVLDKEAISNLKLIQVAEKGYYFDMSTYYPSPLPPPALSESNIANINQNLKLSLAAGGAGQSWNYRVWNNGCGQATRNGGDGRSWYFRITDNGSDLANCATDGEPNNNSCYTCP